MDLHGSDSHTHLGSYRQESTLLRKKRRSHFILLQLEKRVIPVDRYSSYSRLSRVTAWILRFVQRCLNKEPLTQYPRYLSTMELQAADTYWSSVVQGASFAREIKAIKNKYHLPKSSPLLALHPIIDSSGLLWVGGRIQRVSGSYDKCYPNILSGKHPVTKLLIHSEHLRLLHAGPTLLTCSLNQQYHILGLSRSVHSITHNCIICHRVSSRPQTQMFGQLPLERVSLDLVFGVDYAGPFHVKYGPVRKSTLVKTYTCVFVSLSVKAIHLELASDLSTKEFIACLWRFVSWRGKPTVIWSDHGTNFVENSKQYW